jgi:AraC family transcriptional regulator
MLLRHGSLAEDWWRAGSIYNAGEKILLPDHVEQWFQTNDLHVFALGTLDVAPTAAFDRMSSSVVRPRRLRVVDAPGGALIQQINTEDANRFPNGHLFFDFVTKAFTTPPSQGQGVRRSPVPTYRGGLSPVRLRRVVELVRTTIEGEVTLDQLAESAGLSTAHFSHTFRRSTGQSPHQFVLRQKVERAKEMLRTSEMRVLDVAVACGFKTQQHFARVFRRICGMSPTGYRQQEFLC